MTFCKCGQHFGREISQKETIWKNERNKRIILRQIFSK
jgi:hypothetical protein